MDLPFVGLATFAGQRACPDRDRLSNEKPIRVVHLDARASRHA
jgi:hypothetical protein